MDFQTSVIFQFLKPKIALAFTDEGGYLAISVSIRPDLAKNESRSFFVEG